MISKTEYAYSGSNKVSMITTKYDENEQPTGLREKTVYTYVVDNIASEEMFTSVDGITWIEKEKYEYEYDVKGVLRVIAYYEYSVSASTYELITKEFIHYSDDISTFITPDNRISASIYPNPAFNILNISVQEVNTFEYKVYNMNGTLVKAGIGNGGNLTVNVSELNRGIYMIKIVSEGKSFTSKFVKK